MANKNISELNPTDIVQPADLFVLEQSGTAKKLAGQTLIDWVTSYADGHGGIQTVTKTSSSGTNPVVDTYTITYADTTSNTFTVTNGVKGDTGAASYVHLKWAAQQPTADNQMSDSPVGCSWMGVKVDTSSATPEHYTDYAWAQFKGDTGNSISAVTKTSVGPSSPGTTDTYTMYINTSPPTSIGTFTVYNGADSPIGYIGSISMAAASWTEGGGYYTQSVVVDGVSVGNNGKVDLQPDATVLTQMVSDGTIALYIENNNGSLTAYAVGGAPTAALTVQCVVGNIAVEE